MAIYTEFVLFMKNKINKTYVKITPGAAKSVKLGFTGP